MSADERTATEDAPLANEAVQWAILNGLVMAVPGDQAVFTHAPFTLRPSPLPRRLFDEAVALCQPFNRLVHAVSRDTAFLVDVHREVVAVDPFTANLVKILQDVHTEGPAQPLAFGIFRSDYMLHAADASADPATWRLRQVEINTISSAFPALAPRVTALHRYLAHRFGTTGHPDAALPESSSGTLVPAALWRAFELNAAVPAPLKAAHGAVLFIVQAGERNVADQKALEVAVWGLGRVPVLRRTLAEVADQGILDPDRHLRLGDHVVVVAYYRAGYAPRDYESDEDRCWAARRVVERSTAIKCPDIGHHLAGTKKVQQVLCDPARLRRYLSADEADQVARCFAPQYSLTDPNHAAVVALAAEHPHDFVLKPQREGGGNLLADDALRAALTDPTAETRQAYVLMERIRPPTVAGTVVRNGEVQRGPLVCELGIYGLCLGDAATVLHAPGAPVVRGPLSLELRVFLC